MYANSKQKECKPMLNKQKGLKNLLGLKVQVHGGIKKKNSNKAYLPTSKYKYITSWAVVFAVWAVMGARFVRLAFADGLLNGCSAKVGIVRCTLCATATSCGGANYRA